MARKGSHQAWLNFCLQTSPLPPPPSPSEAFRSPSKPGPWRAPRPTGPGARHPASWDPERLLPPDGGREDPPGPEGQRDILFPRGLPGHGSGFSLLPTEPAPGVSVGAQWLGSGNLPARPPPSLWAFGEPWKQKQSSPLTSSSVIGLNGDAAVLVIQREGKGRRSREGSVSQASANRGSNQLDMVGLSCGFWGLDGALRDSHPNQRSGWFKVSKWWRQDSSTPRRWNSSTPGRWPGWAWEGKKGCQVEKGVVRYERDMEAPGWLFPTLQ